MKRTRLWSFALAALTCGTLLFAVGCDDDNGDDTDTSTTGADMTSTTGDATTSTDDVTTSTSDDMATGTGDTTPTDTADMMIPPTGGPFILANDQLLTTLNRIVVDSVVSVGPGFVVIHEDDGSGNPGAVIGQAPLADGGATNVLVTIDRDAVPGETLHAMLHVDDGTIGTYEFPNGDAPAEDADGNIVNDPFGILELDPSVTVVDQVPDPRTEVVVANAVANGPAFVVIHEDQGGSPGGVIGVSAGIGYGSNDTITIDLDREVVDDEVLHAMLHIDAGEIGTYEFPGPDEPETDADGNVVNVPFTVQLPDPFVIAQDQIAVPSNTVVIDTVFSVGPGFLVIHENDNSNMPAAVIGVSDALPDGVSTDVTVTLDRIVSEGETLHAMLHIDEGTIGTYEFPGADEPALDGDGNVVNVPFTAGLAEPYVVASTQVLLNSSQVIVDEALTIGGGFVVIHENDNSGMPGAVIGNSAFLPDGISTNIAIDLDRPANAGETLHAMLHINGDGNMTYDFPGADEPAVDAEGNVINVPFTAVVP